MAAPQVGVTAAVNLDARGTPPGGAPRVLTLGQNVVFNERIETDGAGLVQILLVDGTTFTVGPNSQLTIDKFVYDPNTGDAEVVASIAKGAFRFIGGQASRKAGGATIKTPSGSIGIRGAMVEGNVDGNSETHSLIFGDELTFTGRDGRSQRLFEQGFTLDLSGGGVSRVRRRTADDARTFQTALSGRPGQNGGASQQPTNEGVANSQVSNANTGIGGVPVPTFRPVEATNLEEEETVTNINQVSQPQVVEELGPPPPPVIVAEPVFLAGRVLLAPVLYASPFVAIDLANPGPRGLVGSNAAADFEVKLEVANGLLTGQAPSGGAISLPDLTGTAGDAGLQLFNVAGTSPAGPASGPAFAGRNDFAAYLLGVNGNAGDPFYLFTGTETVADVLGVQNSDIRTYTLTDDPIQNAGAPFFNKTIYGNLENGSKTDLLIVERSPAFFKSFLTWVDISDSEVNGQKSAIFVTSGGGADLGDGVLLTSRRRGSFRASESGPSFNLRGSPVRSIAGAGGRHTFGPNAENFVVGNGASPADPFVDIPVYNPCIVTGCSPAPGTYEDDYNFGTIHVADLITETPIGNFSRSSRVYDGFMNGIAESRPQPGSEVLEAPYAVGALTTPNFSMATNASTSEFAAIGQVSDISDVSATVDRLNLAFGPADGSFGENAFIDNRRFGATYNGNRQNTRLITDPLFSGESELPEVQNVPNTADLSPGSYIVSGRAAPVSGYQHCTQCDFIDWGWWGTRVIADIDGGGGTQRRHEFAHLGTWVAATITHPGDLPTGPTDAVFAGSVIANVSELGEVGTNQRIATGTFDLEIDLSDRDGVFKIYALDGANYRSNVSDASTATQALYSGNLFQIEGEGFAEGVNGSVIGAIVNDGATPAAGTIGQFESAGDGKQIVGTFAGPVVPE